MWLVVLTVAAGLAAVAFVLAVSRPVVFCNPACYIPAPGPDDAIRADAPSGGTGLVLDEATGCWVDPACLSSPAVPAGPGR